MNPQDPGNIAPFTPSNEPTPPTGTPAGAPQGPQPATSGQSAPLSSPPSGSYVKRHWKLVLAGAILLVGGSAGAWYLSQRTPAETPAPATTSASPSPSAAPATSTKASPLTGWTLPNDQADQAIVGVVVENHPNARPQSGLGEAGVVYEANAEGGITRFLAFFLEKKPVVGPVRSLRTYFVDWGLEFNAPVAHAGGNADALDLIGPLGLKSFNALSSAAGSFYRTRDKPAPHNLYTDGGRLSGLLAANGLGGKANFAVSPRKADQPNTSAPHPNIHIEYSYAGYQVDYKYDSASNMYARSMGGTPHVDRNSGQQISVKNIVVQMMPTSYGVTRIGEQTVLMGTVGKGPGWVMRDGQAIACTWSKDNHNARTKLLDAAGKEIPLNVGNTWYSIVPVGKAVSF